MPGCDPGTVLVVLCDLNHCAFEFTAVSQLWRIAFLEPRRRDRLVCGACMVLLFHPFPSELCGTWRLHSRTLFARAVTASKKTVLHFSRIFALQRQPHNVSWTKYIFWCTDFFPEPGNTRHTVSSQMYTASQIARLPGSLLVYTAPKLGPKASPKWSISVICENILARFLRHLWFPATSPFVSRGAKLWMG